MSEEDITAELFSQGVIRCKQIIITRNAKLLKQTHVSLPLTDYNFLLLST